MSNMHRIAWIDREIRNQHYPNCAAIADRFSISVRQAARDVEYLRDSMCAPIQFDRNRQGYCYTEETFSLGHVMMTERQKQGVAHLADRYSQMEGEHATHLARLFQRLIDDSPMDRSDQALPLFPIEPKQLTIFDALQEAISTYEKVELRLHVQQEDQAREIRFSPYIYTFRGENYAVGYCEPSRQIRFFKFSEIQEVVRTEDHFDLTPLLRQADIVPELGYELEEAWIQFDVIEYAWTFRYSSEPMSNGWFRIQYDDPNKLIAALVACPCLCRIQSPSWLRNKYRHELSRKFSNSHL